ncbi:DUF4179 domain-containing protein [Paenibacillus woosongensis]|uniref:DUF4179 domain-containing protein n=1 Tax=Paenibacillus woosongensis TaxID=307580 RepID=A0AA95L1U0_9BACL|nr:DUF4179 domain-containing protein [Paenibacillus woosongensis]WHX49256.1 DUF4179 domain-containing protein [Paenibacillus woosongensis]
MPGKLDFHREEELLTDYYKSHNAAAEQIHEEKLDQALLAGITSGHSRYKRFAHHFPWKQLTGALLACCLLLFGGWQMWTSDNLGRSAFHASRSDIPSFVYNSMTPKLKDAANHGLYQPINETITQGNYQVTIDGVLADRTEMIVFYTSVNLPGNVPISPRDAKFLDTHGNSLNAMIEYPSSEVNPGTPTNVQHGEFTLSFPKNDVPAHFTFSAKWGHPQASDEAHELIEFPIQLDSSKYAGLEHRIEVNRSAKMGPYSLTLTDVILNPLSTRVYLQIESAEENLYQSLIDPVLWITQEGSRNSLTMQMSTMNAGPNELLIQFDSLYYAKWQDLAFGASGMEEALGKDLELVLDTEKQKIVSAPDDSIRLSRVVPSEEFIDIYFEMDHASDRRALYFDLDEEFTDGDGKKHTLMVGRSSYRSGDAFQTVHYKLKPGNYAQPLTFKLLSYPGTDINQPFEIPLLSGNNPANEP